MAPPVADRVLSVLRSCCTARNSPRDIATAHCSCLYVPRAHLTGPRFGPHVQVFYHGT
ncbi:hypothetical protein BDR04DRAFT_1112100 [Suillus decipiens]|nr:hypothetical protein BDR04DRAFT_1112100 [Suillus decipiens]